MRQHFCGTQGSCSATKADNVFRACVFVCGGEQSVTWACIPGKDGSPVSGKAATVQQALAALLLCYNWKFAREESNQCYKN